MGTSQENSQAIPQVWGREGKFPQERFGTSTSEAGELGNN